MSEGRRRAIIERPSQRGLKVLPLLLEVGHELNEAYVPTKVVQARLVLEQWIARVPVHRALPKPLHRQIDLLQQRVRDSDVVRGVMKMTESFPPLCGLFNFLLSTRRPLDGRQH